MRQYYFVSRDPKLLKFSGFIRDDSAKEANFAHFIDTCDRCISGHS
jgi:hypothetical protein